MFATTAQALDFAHDQTLTVADTTSSNRVGETVAATTNYLASGAPLDDTLGTDAGAVYLYEKVGAAWTFRQKITASDGAAGDHFGASLAMNGTNLLVGTPWDDIATATDAGSVYSFDLENGTWLQTEKLNMPTPVSFEQFGHSVDVDAQRAVIGVPGYNGATSTANTGRGAISIWNRSGINWTNPYFHTYTSPVTSTVRAGFGYSVSLSDNKIAVGAPRDYAATTGQGGNAGSISVLTYDNGTSSWASEARFHSTTPVASDNYGNTVDIQGNTLVTANYAISATSPKIFTYTYSGGSWSSATVIIPTTVTTSSKRYIGQAMDIASDESSILIGSYMTVSGTDYVGRVFVLKPNETTSVWEQAQEISSPHAPTSGGWFGYDVTYSGTSPVIGSPMVVAATGTRGAVYTYTGGDGTPPAITLSSATSSHLNSSFIVTADLSEPVVGFAQDDIAVTSGASIDSFTQVTPTQYTFRVSPVTDRQYTIGIDASRMQDAAGNNNLASNALIRTYDTTAPAASVISPAQNTYFASSTISASVRINDTNGNLNDLTSDDITITNGTISNFNASVFSTYTTGDFTITPTGQGPVTFYVEDGAVIDQAGNASTVSTTRTIYYDTTKPTPSFNTPLTPTNASPFTVTLSFDEPVADIQDVSANQISITNGTISNFQEISTQQYTFDVTPAGLGIVSLDYAANQVADRAGNTNNAAANYDVTFDNFGPEVTIETASDDPTNQAPITFSVYLSEPVTGLTASDFSITNGSASGLTQQSPTEYALVVAPDQDGTISVSLPAQSATDSVSNGNQLSNTKTVQYDTTRPTVSVMHSYISPTNASPLNYTIRFSEPVSDLTSSGLTLTNASLTSLTKLDSREYTLSVTPSDGIVTVRVNDSAVSDPAGNPSREGDASLTSDRTAPSGTVHTLRTNNQRPSITGTISEPVDSVTVTINGTTFNAAINNGNLTWAVNANLFGPLSDGVYNVSLAIVDQSQNSGTDSTNNELTIDTDEPTVTITSAPATNQSPVIFTVTASRGITGLTAADFTVTGGTVTGVSTISQSSYEVDVTPSGNGTVSLQLKENTVSDDAGNTNPASNTARTVYDTVRPGITLSGDTTPINAAFDVTLIASEDIQGLTASDISVTRGTVASITKQSESSYRISIQPTTPGQVAVQMPAGGATDTAGNTNTVSNSLQRLYDNAPPATPTVTSQVVETRQPKLTGMFDSVNSTNVRVTISSRSFSSNAPDTPLVLNGNQWEIDFAQTNIKLEFGVYDIRVITTDNAGNTSTDTTQNELVINSAGTITGTVDSQTTANTRPEITGTVSRQNAAVKVKILDDIYDAVNNHDGSWTLPGNTIQPLTDGTYNVELTFTDGNMEGTDSTVNELIIDTAAPRGTFTRIVTTKTSPKLSGTVDTTNTVVQIEIEGKVYRAAVSGTQWSIAEGTISPAFIPGAHTAIMYLERNGKQAVEVIRRAVTVQTETVPPHIVTPPKPVTPVTPTKPTNPTPPSTSNTTEPAAPTPEPQKEEIIRSPQTAVQPVFPAGKNTDKKSSSTWAIATFIAACTAAIALAGGSSAFLIGWKRRRKKDEQQML